MEKRGLGVICILLGSVHPSGDGTCLFLWGTSPLLAYVVQWCLAHVSSGKPEQAQDPSEDRLARNMGKRHTLLPRLGTPRPNMAASSQSRLCTYEESPATTVTPLLWPKPRVLRSWASCLSHTCSWKVREGPHRRHDTITLSKSWRQSEPCKHGGNQEWPLQRITDRLTAATKAAIGGNR